MIAPVTRVRSQPSPPRAPPASAEPSEYHASIDQGLAEYQAGNYAEARALFARAHALYPNARTLRGLGMVEFELKNYVESANYLQDALDTTERRLEGELRQQTQELLDRTRHFLAQVRVDVEPAGLAGALLRVDGEPVPHALDRPLTLAVGEHVITLRAPGYEEERRTFNVTGGEERRLSIRLQHLPERSGGPSAAPARPATPAPIESEQRPLWKNPWLWGGVAAVVVAGVVTGIVLAANREPEARPLVHGDIGGSIATLLGDR